MATRPVFFCFSTTASASLRLSASGISTCTCLPASQALYGLRGVHLRRRRENDRVEVRQLQGVGEVGRGVADAIFRRRFLRLVELASNERDDLDARDILDGVEMLQAEGSGAGERRLDGLCHSLIPCMPSLTPRSRARDARLRCSTPAHGRSDARPSASGPPAISAIAPRAISHITSSMPSEPASRTYSMFGIFARSRGIVDQLVEELVVPIPVDQAGARTLQLVAHAAGAPDLHLEILGIALDRLADRLSEREAARARRHGMLHDIDGEGDDLARPGVDLAEHAGQSGTVRP